MTRRPSPPVRIRVLRAIQVPVLMMLLVPAACITGHEAEDSLEPSRSKQLADLDRAHEIGIISDVEYQANRRAILEGE